MAATRDYRDSWLLVAAAFAAIVAVLLLPDFAYADGVNPNHDSFKVMCNAAFVLIRGKIGAGIASMAIIIMSVAAITGRTSWSSAAMVIGGLAVLFGASELAYRFGSLANSSMQDCW